MPAPKKAAAPKKPASTTAAAKPAAKKPAPAKKPAAKKPAASIKAPAVKKPAVAKKAPTAPAVKPAAAKKIPASKKPVGTVLKAPAKPVAKAPAKPRAKVAPADGIKKTAIPAKVTTSTPKRTAAKTMPESLAADLKALPGAFSNSKATVATERPSDLNPAITVLDAELSDHVVLAHTNPLGSDYTVNFFAGVKGGSAYRQMHLTATQKSKKRLSIEQTINSVLKAALGYENKRSQGKAFRGITALSVVVTRNSTSVTQPLSILLHLNPLQAMAF